MTRYSRRWSLAAATAVLCLCLVPLAACGHAERADQATTTDAAATRSPEVTGATSAPGAAARTVFLDPETGRLTRQPPDKATALRLSNEFARSISTSHEGVQIQTMPNGMKVASRPGGFRTAIMATIDKDGNVVVRDVATPAAEAGEGANR